MTEINYFNYEDYSYAYKKIKRNFKIFLILNCMISRIELGVNKKKLYLVDFWNFQFPMDTMIT